MIACVCAAFVLLLIVFSMNRAYIRLSADGMNVELVIVLRFLDGMIPLRLRLCAVYEVGRGHRLDARLNGKPLRKKKKEGKKPGSFFGLYIKKMMRFLNGRFINLDARVGIRAEADLTARLCGLIMVFSHSLFAFMMAKNKGLKPSCVVSPDFNRDVFHLRVFCMIEMRTGHSIVAAIQAAFDVWKGAMLGWRTKLRALWAPQWKA